MCVRLPTAHICAVVVHEFKPDTLSSTLRTSAAGAQPGVLLGQHHDVVTASLRFFVTRDSHSGIKAVIITVQFLQKQR